MNCEGKQKSGKQSRTHYASHSIKFKTGMKGRLEGSISKC